MEAIKLLGGIDHDTNRASQGDKPRNEEDKGSLSGAQRLYEAFTSGVSGDLGKVQSYQRQDIGAPNSCAARGAVQ